MCLTDFVDWRYIHYSWFVFSTHLVSCCPHGRRNFTCVLLPLLSLTSALHLPKLSVQYIKTVCGCGGEGVLSCAVDHILQELYTLFLTRFRTYKIASPPHTKMTCRDDIKGLVSLKFLRPWCSDTPIRCVRSRSKPNSSNLSQSWLPLQRSGL